MHLEEDTGKNIHQGNVSLIDFDRSGVPLMEIVFPEPDLHTAEEVKAYAEKLRAIVRYLGVITGDMEKGVIRFEPNISIRPVGATEFGTRTELKTQFVPGIGAWHGLRIDPAGEVAGRGRPGGAGNARLG